jgi:glutathione synthase
VRFVFVMDPVSTVIVDEDTTFAFMLAADAAGHACLFTRVEDVHLDGPRLLAHARPATPSRTAPEPVALGPAETIDLADVDAVWVRKDPPFDSRYLWLTLLLEHLRGKTLVVNDPRALRDANEKLYALEFPELCPETLVASDKATIRAFVERVGGQGVIKPVDGHGGLGIFALRSGDSNVNAVVETVTHHGTRVAMVQRFLPEVAQGDKRILLLDGEPLGAILRVAQGGDIRSNIHVGGSVVPAELTAADHRIVETVGPRLRDEGLLFVGLDVIGPYLTEVNVTSPTGIQQASRFAGRDLAADVVARVAERAAGHGGP